MRLKRPCEHGMYDGHRQWGADGEEWPCTGGEFVADDALVVEWGTARTVIAMEIAGYHMSEADANAAAVRIVDALAVWEAVR